MKVTNPAQLEALKRFVESVGIPFDPSDKFRMKSYWDTQAIAQAVGAAGRTTFFNSGTSSSKLNAYTGWGCNLPNPGVLPGNTSFIVTELRTEFLFCATVAKAKDALILIQEAMIEYVKAGDDVALDELPLGRTSYASGLRPITSGYGATDDVPWGVIPVEDGEQLSVESRVVWGRDQQLEIVVSHNGPGGALATAAGIVTKFSVYGLEITHAK